MIGPPTYFYANSPTYPYTAGEFAQPNGYQSSKLPVTAFPQNQSQLTRPEKTRVPSDSGDGSKGTLKKTWLNAGIEEVKKGARPTLFGTLAYGALPFLYLLGRLIDQKKVVPSDWKKLLYGVAGWGVPLIAMCFVKGVSDNHFKTRPLPKAMSPIENGILAVRKSWAAYAAVATGFSLMLTPIWKKEKPVGVKPFLSACWKNFRLWAPAILATSSALEFGIGAYQFGKPPKDKSA